MRLYIINICDTWLGFGSAEPKVVFDRHNHIKSIIKYRLDEKHITKEIFEDTFDSIEMSLEQHFIEYCSQLQKGISISTSAQPLSQALPTSARGLDKLRKMLTT